MGRERRSPAGPRELCDPGGRGGCPARGQVSADQHVSSNPSQTLRAVLLASARTSSSPAGDRLGGRGQASSAGLAASPDFEPLKEAPLAGRFRPRSNVAAVPHGFRSNFWASPAGKTDDPREVMRGRISSSGAVADGGLAEVSPRRALAGCCPAPLTRVASGTIPFPCQAVAARQSTPFDLAAYRR